MSNTYEYGICHIRKDLLKQDLAVPVGPYYLFTEGIVLYRWVNYDERFEVFTKDYGEKPTVLTMSFNTLVFWEKESSL